MPNLLLHNRPVESVFSLLGERENAITFSMGWVLSQSPAVLEGFLKKAGAGTDSEPSQLVVALQEFQHDSGITDVEIRGDRLHVIVEAKRGWSLPTEQQLSKYVPRFTKTNAVKRLIVTMSECSQAFAGQYQPATVGGIPVKHISWSEMSSICRITGGSHAEKRLTREFRNYLATIVNMQPQDSNWVYVVSLGNKAWIPGLTFIQVVEARKRYFHPYGRGGWPKEPPNYIGFRYRGVLQSVHHIESAEVIRNFHKPFPEYPNRDEPPHFIYKLGPAIRPAHTVRSGAVIRSQRVWAMLDLLLTSNTISAARDASKERIREA